MKRIKGFISDLLWRMFWPKKPPAETGIKFGKKDEDGFKEVIRDGKLVGKLYVWDKATAEELRAIAGIGRRDETSRPN